MCEILTGVRYHDVISSRLFTVVLNMAPQRTAQKGNIVNKSKQICAYADDTVLVTRNIQKGGNQLLPAWKLKAEKWAKN